MAAFFPNNLSKERSSESNQPAVAVGNQLAGVHILSVDDDPDSLEITAFTLELAGANVTSVTSGEQALQALNQLIPDVMISDVGMPGMDGYRLMQKIRALPAEKGGRLLAIALTAYAQESNRQTLIASGFQEYLVKPVSPEMLVEIVYQVIDESRPVETPVEPPAPLEQC